jgi:ATP-dependent protease HslVU (ClpYQ) peptidase subunit
MSIVIAYKKDGVIYMGTDTRSVVNDYKKNNLSPCDYKIQKLENGMLLGVSAEREEKQLILAYSDIFTLDKSENLTKKHIVTKIIPKLMEVFSKAGLIQQEENETPYIKAMILLAHKDKLFEICSGFAVIRYENYQSIGGAGEYADAVLFNTKESDDVNDRIIKALDVASKNTYYVGKPYLLIDTKNLEYKLVGED